MLRERRIDLLITDYAMPGLNGSDLIEAALALQPRLRTAMLSGYAELPEGAELPVPRLAKPYDDSDLRRLIAAVMDEQTSAGRKRAGSAA